MPLEASDSCMSLVLTGQHPVLPVRQVPVRPQALLHTFAGMQQVARFAISYLCSVELGLSKRISHILVSCQMQCVRYPPSPTAPRCYAFNAISCHHGSIAIPFLLGLLLSGVFGC